MKEIAIAWGPALISGVVGPLCMWFLNRQSERRAKVTLAKVEEVKTETIEVKHLANSTLTAATQALDAAKNGRLADSQASLDYERGRDKP